MTSIEVRGGELSITIEDKKPEGGKRMVALGLYPPGGKITMTETDLYKLEYAIRKYQNQQALELLRRVKEGEI